MKKKKDNGLKAIICLAVATIAVGVASIAVSRMDKTTSNTPGVSITVTPLPGDSGNVAGNDNQGTTVEKTGTVLSVEGASAKIKEARQNEDGTYTVVITENGFGGEMIIEAVYSADGQTLVSYDVLSHSETPTIGSLVDEDDYKALLAGVKLPVTANGLDISAIIGTVEETPEVSGTETEAAALTDGVYTAQAEADEKGNYAFVSITVEGGKIVAATWDEVYNGSLKSELSTTGKYVMKPVWDTQAKSVSKYVVDNQGTAGLLNDKGYTDVVSGVSINVAGFAALADQAIANANGKDGVYEVKAEADDKGNYAFVSVTIEGGKITAVTWDEVYNGSLKSELSLTGKYVMKPVWDTQAKSMCQYVVDNQTTAGLNLTEAGKTDVVSGVSISVNGFTGLVEDALKQASVTGVIPAPAPVAPAPAAKVDATVVDVVSGATISSKAVIRAIDEGFVFLRDFVLNK